MDDLSALNPAKLKRKMKRGAQASVVDMPAISDVAESASLLGENRLSGSSFTDLPLITADTNTSEHQSQPHDSTPDAESASERQVSNVSLSDERDDAIASPLDLLPAKKVKTRSVADRPTSEVSHVETNATETRKNHPSPIKNTPHSEGKTPDNALPADKHADTLATSREFHQRALDTLTKLQNTNAQNERQYKTILFVALAFMIAVVIVVCFAYAKLYRLSQANELRALNERYTRVLDEKEILASEFNKEKAGSEAAFAVYQLIEKGLFEDAIERFNETRDALTHPAEIALLEQKIDALKWKLAENAFHDGLMLYNAQNFEQSRDAFFKSLTLKENTAYASRLFYFLAMSLYQLGDFEGARKYFMSITASDLGADMEANARFYRAVSEEKLGNDADAYEQFDGFLKKFRYHKFADEAVKHRSKLAPSVKR